MWHPAPVERLHPFLTDVDEGKELPTEGFVTGSFPHGCARGRRARWVPWTRPMETPDTTLEGVPLLKQALSFDSPFLT